MNACEKYLLTFLTVGLLATLGLLFLMTAPSGFSSGDGSGHVVGSSTLGLVLPYSCYFVCGIVATLISNRKGRVALVIIAHSAPFISFVFARANDGYAFIVIDLVTFAAFAFAWVHMLRRA